MIVKPHSECTAEELMTAVSIEILGGVATLRYPEDDVVPEPAEPNEAAQ